MSLTLWRPHERWRRAAALSLGVLGVGILALGALIAGKQRGALGAGPPSVEVVTVNTGTAAETVVAEGVLVPSTVSNVSVMPSVEGRMTRVLVDVGSRVERGQVLAELEPLDEGTNLASARAAVEGARAQYQLAQRPNRAEEIQQAAADVSLQQAKLDLVLHPHRPEEIRQVEMKLEGDRQSVAEASAHLALLKSFYRPDDIAAAEEILESAKARLALAKSTEERMSGLFTRGYVSAVLLEKDETKRLLAAEAVVQARAHLSLLNDGSRTEVIAMAQAALERTQAALRADEQIYAVMVQGSRPEEVAEATSSLERAKLAYKMLLDGGRSETIRVAAAGLHQKQLQEQQNARILEQRFVRAPIAGIVISRNVNPGEVVSAKAARTNTTAPLERTVQGLFTIAGDQYMEFQASVDQRYYASLRISQPATVNIEAIPGRSFSGTVTRIDPLVNATNPSPSSGSSNAAMPLTFAAWVRVEDPQRQIVSGQIGLVRIRRQTTGLAVPRGALQTFALGEALVYVEKAGVVRRRQIHCGDELEGEIRVLDGLRRGERVVASTSSPLEDGMRVHAVVRDVPGESEQRRPAESRDRQ